MRGAVRLVVIVAFAALMAGCRPEIDFGGTDRVSQIDAVKVDATVLANGAVHVSQRYTFDSGDGGTVGLPDLAGTATSITGASNVKVDGKPATPEGGDFHPQLHIAASHATVEYDLTGALERYQDVAVVHFDVLPSPEGASRQDPDVPVDGTLRLPEGQPGTIEPHFHGGRDSTASVTDETGLLVKFSSKAPIWLTNHDLDVAFPSARLPFVQQIPIDFLSQFHLTESIRDTADAGVTSSLGTVDTAIDASRWVLTALAFGIPGIFWLLVLKAVVARLRRRHRVAGDIPRELADPPTNTDPAVVAVLEGEGRPERTAVAGTVLALAHRKALNLHEVGDGIVVNVPLSTTANNGSEQIVLDALRGEATTQNGASVVQGKRVWRGSTRWFSAFRRDARRRARDQGLATPWAPLAPLSGALIGTGVGAAIFYFTNPAVYIGVVFGAQIVAVAVSLVSGWTLTDSGWRERALWHSFARYIRHQGKLDHDVGPEGVVIWGPYLVYGSVLGEAEDAAAPLTP